MNDEYKILTVIERQLKDGLEDDQLIHAVTSVLTIIADRKAQLFNSPQHYDQP